MKLLFVHSHRFAYKEKNYFSPGGLPKSVWKRYLEFFDNVIVLGRSLYNSNNSKLTISSREGVTFELLDYLESPISFIRYKNRIKDDIKDIIDKYEIDAVIARLPSSLGYLAIVVCKDLDIPYAIEVVGCAYDAIYNYKFSPWYNIKNLGVKILAPISFNKMRHYVNNANYTIYVTKYNLQEKYPPSSNSVTAYASNVVLPEFGNNVLSEHIAFLNSDKNEIVLGMIGNLDVHYKGYDIALKALSRIKKELPFFKLYFAGGGKGEMIKKEAAGLGLSNNIVFVGQLKSGEDVFRYLDKLDIYLHPSRAEGMPRSLIEAMGRGCPCLGSSVGGIPELLGKDYMHTPEDYKTLSEQILQLSKSKELLEKAAETNFETAKDYSIDVLSERRREFWGSFYKYVVNKSSER